MSLTAVSAPAARCINFDFAGTAFTALTYRDKPAVLARDVGRVLGYADDGKRFLSALRQWGEHIEDHDLVILRGPELRALKSRVTGAVTGRAASAMLLTEPGLHLALAKTEKPAGRAFRRFLVDTVLPAFRTPAPAPTPPEDQEALRQVRAILAAQTSMMLQDVPWSVLVRAHQMCQAAGGRMHS